MKTNRMTFTSLVALMLLLLAACSQTPTPVVPQEPTLSSQALVWQLQTLDSAGIVGLYTSLALDSSGNSVISYFDNTNNDLKLVHCGNATCTSGNTIQTVDSAGIVGEYTSLALDSSGNPVIAYRGNGNLKLAHCGNATCTSGNTIQSVDSVGHFISMVLDSSGNPVISYYDVINQDLKLAHCGNANCTSGNTIQTVDSAGNTGWNTSLALDSSGNPVISYFNDTNADLKLVHCGNATCTSGNTIQTVDGVGFVGEYTSLALDSSGNPVISYRDITNGSLKLANCGNATCTSGNTLQTVDSAGIVGLYTSLALDSSGNPVISYFDITSNDLKLANCGNATCTSGNTIQTVDGAGFVGRYTSLVLDSSGNPVISYWDINNGNLKLAQLVDDSIPPSVTINQASGQADPTDASPINFTLTFSEPVMGTFDPGEVILSGTAGATTATVTGPIAPRTYNIAVSGMTSSSTVIASFAANALTDAAGNGNTASTSTDNTVTFGSDTTPPVITPTIEGTLGNNGWYTSDVSVSWTVTDAESAISNQTGCDAATVSADTTGVTFTCSATSAGGTDSKSVTIKRDGTAPTIAFEFRTAANGAGWNNSDVTLEWSCSDATSGAVNATVSQTISSEGNNQSSIGSCEDNAGNSVSDTQANINIDKTAPTLNPVVSLNPVLLNGSATVSSGASDSLSGLASQSCGSPDTSSVGSKSVSCSAIDNAGNSASANASYNVIYNFRGFFLPVQNAPALNGVKAGWVVPFSFNLGGNFGRNVITSTVSVPINCSTLAPQGNATATQQDSSVSQTSEQALSSWGLSSNLTSNNLTASSSTSTLYIYLWNTDKSWKNTCRQFSMTLNDGTQHKANFKFK